MLSNERSSNRAIIHSLESGSGLEKKVPLSREWIFKVRDKSLWAVLRSTACRPTPPIAPCVGRNTHIYSTNYPE